MIIRQSNLSKAIILFICALQMLTVVTSAQVSNNEQAAGLISINLPKTPESQGVERYGKIPVNESTGQPDISIPLYTVSSRSLQVPIKVSYNASGIRVSQEASWVGLGFDLIAGGRITVETRGSIDNDGVTPLLFSQQQLKEGIAKLFNRLGDSSSLAMFTYASTCQGCDTNYTHNIPDDAYAISAMASFGVGDPDIFHANFLGNSFKFFYDAVTDTLRFLGERNWFNISYTKDGNQRINSWNIIDNSGIQYFFGQVESTTMTLPPYGPLYDNTANSAWLLTKILHPDGDSIRFNYNVLGNSYPVSEWSASLMYKRAARSHTFSSPQVQNEVIQHPAYLTSIESAQTKVEFLLSNREDIKGSGSRKLDEIIVRNKMDSTVVKKLKFSYSYFNASLSGTCYQNSPDSVGKYLRLRLKLDAVTPNDSSLSLQTPFKFFYIGGGPPHKRSFSQDYWGFYNGIGGNYSDPCSPLNLLPNTGMGAAENYSTLNGFHAGRFCVPSYMEIMTLDSLVYPTGGSVKLIYEPHYSYRYETGGGLRVKTIRQYASGRLASSMNYTYQPGTYMGKVNYARVEYLLHGCEDMTGNAELADQDRITITSHGLSNDHDQLIIYPLVTIQEINEKGQSNGRVQKYFKAPNPYYTSGGLGFNVQYAHWPTTSGGGYGTMPRLYEGYTSYPATPRMELEGSLFKEDYYDDQDSLVRRIEYFYSQRGYDRRFYRAQIMDLRPGGNDAYVCGWYAGGGYGQEFASNGARRFTAFVSPGKSYFTVLDSVVEHVYFNGNPVRIKKAFGYNKYYQREFETNYNSDGTQTINRTMTSMAFEPNYSLGTSGETADLYNLRQNHIYDLPIEQTEILRRINGDSVVVKSRVNFYKRLQLSKVFVMESQAPVSFRSQFVPIYYNYTGYPGTPGGSSLTISMDTRYRLHSSGVYNDKGQIKYLEELSGKQVFIWDDDYNSMLAQVTNADTSDIAYTSFETGATGRWTYSASGKNSQALSPTGKRAYSLSAGNISIGGLNVGRTYTVSYWSKSGAQNVNSTTGVAGSTIFGWTYYEHRVQSPFGGSITITGTGIIDELRLFPEGALMITNTYLPLIGLSEMADANSRISYFEYDAIGRLARIRDAKRNILRQFEYKFMDVFNYPYGNTGQSQLFVKNDCPAGYIGTNLNYSVPASKYGSFLSVADANRKALKEIAESGSQERVNQTGSCNPYYSFTSCCGYGTSASLSLTSTGSVNFSIAVYGNGSGYGQIGTLSGILFVPSTSRYINVSSGGKSYTIVFYSNGNVNIMGPSFTGGLVLQGTYAL